MSFYCSRIDHGCRIEPDGLVKPCCTFRYPGWQSMEEMHASQIFQDVKNKQNTTDWPMECGNCKQKEDLGIRSVRTDSNNDHVLFQKIKSDYLHVDAAVNNLCNLACQTCSPEFSTSYAKVFKEKNRYKKDGQQAFQQVMESGRVIELELLGGEPLFNPYTIEFLNNPPDSLRRIRIISNGTRFFDFEPLTRSKKKIQLVLSIDGLEKVFEYCRWPAKWHVFQENFKSYLGLQGRYSNFTVGFILTISALNVRDIDKVTEYAKAHGVILIYNTLTIPDVLSIKYSNSLTRHAICNSVNLPIGTAGDNEKQLQEWLARNDAARQIDYRHYLGDING
jgi:4Fe-4S single cluster domain